MVKKLDFAKTETFIRSVYHTDDFIALHEPYFDDKEKIMLCQCIDSTYVSSVGEFVTQFEQKIAHFCGVKRAVACVNGTSALHIALKVNGIKPKDLVITQPLSFVATANAITYCGANPVFVDVDQDTLGLSPEKLEDFLKKNQGIKAVVPMHTFGHPCRISEIKYICEKYGLILIEDCAESLGSFYQNHHTGTFGDSAVISFNGNKIITTGGGGMILFNDDRKADEAKYLTTQAKDKHPWAFWHSQTGYNYRMPNLNAALGLAQIEKIDFFLEQKRKLAELYSNFFEEKFVHEPQDCRSNFWLQTILTNNKEERDDFLNYMNTHKIMTRPVWTMLCKLPMFANCLSGDLYNAQYLEDRLVNLPSGVIKNEYK